MKFSIITITHNRGYIIHQAIQSVIGQSYNDYEHIIIDDGSTDDTELVVKKFNSDKIKYHKVKKNKQLSSLWNIGIRLSKGYYIAILDSDDSWKPHKLSIINQYLNTNPDQHLIFHNVSIVENKKIRTHIDKKLLTQKMDLRYLLNNNIPVYSSSMVFSKKLTSEIGILDENLFDGIQDYILRTSAYNNVCYLKDVLTIIIKHDKNLTNGIIDLGYYELLNTFKKLKELGHLTLQEFQTYKEQNIYRLLNYYYSTNSFERYKKTVNIYLSDFNFSLNKIKAVIKLSMLFFSYKIKIINGKNKSFK